jgi:hypothetical protein
LYDLSFSASQDGDGSDDEREEEREERDAGKALCGSVVME